MKSKKIKIAFDGKLSKEAADSFMSWFLDGGGLTDFVDSLELDGMLVEDTNWDVDEYIVKFDISE